MKYLVILALASVALGSPSKNKGLITINGRGRVAPLQYDSTQSLVDWYDCSGKADGNYVHPNDCTRFMSCVAQSYAYERFCADCHVEENGCPTGRLHYDHPQDSCLWAYEAGCVTDGGNQTETSPPATTPSQPLPTEDPGNGGGTSSGPVVTEDPGNGGATSSAPVVTEDPGNGGGDDDSCDPDDCWTEGYCQSYRWCEREASDHKGTGKNGTWAGGECGDNLYFNPNHNSVHGGTCDFWENLDKETKDKYNTDPTCISAHCEWKPDAESECSPKYWYFHPEQNGGVDKEMSCPKRNDGEQLLWDQSKKSCHFCHRVMKSNSEPCC